MSRTQLNKKMQILYQRVVDQNERQVENAGSNFRRIFENYATDAAVAVPPPHGTNVNFIRERPVLRTVNGLLGPHPVY